MTAEIIGPRSSAPYFYRGAHLTSYAEAISLDDVWRRRRLLLECFKSAAGTALSDVMCVQSVGLR